MLAQIMSMAIVPHMELNTKMQLTLRRNLIPNKLLVISCNLWCQVFWIILKNKFFSGLMGWQVMIYQSINLIELLSLSGLILTKDNAQRGWGSFKEMPLSIILMVEVRMHLNQGLFGCPGWCGRISTLNPFIKACHKSAMIISLVGLCRCGLRALTIQL